MQRQDFVACKNCGLHSPTCRKKCPEWHSEHILYEIRKKKIEKAKKTESDIMGASCRSIDRILNRKPKER